MTHEMTHTLYIEQQLTEQFMEPLFKLCESDFGAKHVDI